MAVTIVSVDELQRLWDENHVSEKRKAGVFSEIIAHRAEPDDPSMKGTMQSVIIKLLTASGRHIGTLHEIIYLGPADASPHSHPKDYTLRDCSRVRIAHKQEFVPQPRKRRQRRRAARPEDLN